MNGMVSLRRDLINEKQKAAELELLLKGIRKEVELSGGASMLSPVPVPLTTPPQPHQPLRSESRPMSSPGVSPILSSGQLFPKSPTVTPKESRWQPPVVSPIKKPAERQPLPSSPPILQMKSDLEPLPTTPPSLPSPQLIENPEHRKEIDKEKDEAVAVTPLTPVVKRSVSPKPRVSPRKKAIAERKARLAEDEVVSIETAFQPLTHLGPFYFKIFKEIVSAIGEEGHPAATKYLQVLTDADKAFDTAWEGFLKAQNLAPAEFLPDTYNRKALEAPITKSPFRIAVVGPEEAGIDHLTYHITQRVVREIRDESSMVLAVDWTRILPPAHKEVDLSQMYCRLVQHAAECIAVYKPSVRSKMGAVVGYWKRLITQHHHPHLPDVVEDSSVLAGWRALGVRLQGSWHDKKLTSFCKAMFLVPHVMADGFGFRKVMLAYSKMECLSGAVFLADGKKVKEHTVITSCVHTITVCNASVVLSLSHRTLLELNAEWAILSTEGMVHPADLEGLIPSNKIPTLIKQTAGIPEYVHRVVRAGRKITIAASRHDSEHLATKKKQLIFLKDAAATIMARVDRLTDDIRVTEEFEAYETALS